MASEIDNRVLDFGSTGQMRRMQTAALMHKTRAAKSRFTIKIIALPGGGGPQLDNFDPLQSYTWTIASGTSITGFDPGHFQIDSTGFENTNTNHGGFALSFSGGDVKLTYVPEPAAGVVVMMAGFALARRRRGG